MARRRCSFPTTRDRASRRMDRAVLGEYGWDDIPTNCEFLSDHESEEASSTKRFWLYRWPDHVRDEVLGRLIDLCAQRAKEERENEESKVAELIALQKAPHAFQPEMQSEELSFLVPPPLFADQDD